MISNDERQALLAAKPKRERQTQLGRKLRFEGTRWPCAHCGAQSEIKTAYMVTVTLRETFYGCTNYECGHCFVVIAEVGRTTVPSATPNPAVNIPLSSHIRRSMVRVLLDNAPEAAHVARFTAPVTGDLFEPDAPP